MSEERKTIYLCLAHMSEEGWEQKYVKDIIRMGVSWIGKSSVCLPVQLPFILR